MVRYVGLSCWIRSLQVNACMLTTVRIHNIYHFGKKIDNQTLHGKIMKYISIRIRSGSSFSSSNNPYTEGCRLGVLEGCLLA